MPRFTLAVFDRYDVLNTELVYWDSETISIEQAFEECLQSYWGGFEGKVNFRKSSNDRLGFDQEETSYLFWEN